MRGRELLHFFVRGELGLLARCEFFGGTDDDDVVLPALVQPLGAQHDVERLIPGDVLKAQGQVSRDRVADDDILAAGVGQQLQHRPHIDVLEIQRQTLAGVLLLFVGGGGSLRRGLDLDGVLIVRLVGQLFEVALGADHQARATLHPKRVDGLHRRREIHDVIAAHEILRHQRAGEVDDDLIAFLAYVDRGARIRQLHDHPAGAVGAAPEIDGADGAFGRRCALTCTRASHGGLLGCLSRLAAQSDDDGIAVDLGGVRQQGLHVDDQAGAAVGLGRKHGIHAAGVHVEPPRRETQRRVRQVERDARRLVDGERQWFGSRAVQVQFELHLLTRQGLNVDRLELERIRGLHREADCAQCEERHRADHRRSYLE